MNARNVLKGLYGQEVSVVVIAHQVLNQSMESVNVMLEFFIKTNVFQTVLSAMQILMEDVLNVIVPVLIARTTSIDVPTAIQDLLSILSVIDVNQFSHAHMVDIEDLMELANIFARKILIFSIQLAMMMSVLQDGGSINPIEFVLKILFQVDALLLFIFKEENVSITAILDSILIIKIEFVRPAQQIAIAA